MSPSRSFPPLSPLTLLILVTIFVTLLINNVDSSPLLTIQQTASNDPEWVCTSTKNSSIYTPENCLLPAGCTLRSVRCGHFDTESNSYVLFHTDNQCINNDTLNSTTQPARIRADCTESVACASLQCAQNHGICKFDQTDSFQPWFCECSDGFSGDQCNVCAGTPSTTSPDLHQECSSRGKKAVVLEIINQQGSGDDNTAPMVNLNFQNSNNSRSFFGAKNQNFGAKNQNFNFGAKNQNFNVQSFHNFNTLGSIEPTEVCGCQCNSLRSNSTIPVPLFGGSTCQCNNTFVGLEFTDIYYSDYTSNIEIFQILQKNIKLLIVDIGIDINQVLLWDSYSPIIDDNNDIEHKIAFTGAQVNLNSLDDYVIALYPTTSTIYSGAPLTVYFGVQLCNTTTDDSNDSNGNDTTIPDETDTTPIIISDAMDMNQIDSENKMRLLNLNSMKNNQQKQKNQTKKIQSNFNNKKQSIPIQKMNSLQQNQPQNSITILIDQYNENDNSLIHDSTLWQFPSISIPPTGDSSGNPAIQPTPTLTSYIPTMIDESDNNDLNSPFHQPVETNNPNKKPTTWTLTPATWISGTVMIVVFCALYFGFHNLILYKYNEVYEPERKAAEMTEFTSQYRSLFINYSYLCADTPVPAALIPKKQKKKSKKYKTGQDSSPEERLPSNDIKNSPYNGRIRPGSADEEIIRRFIEAIRASDHHPNASYPQRPGNPYTARPHHDHYTMNRRGSGSSTGSGVSTWNDRINSRIQSTVHTQFIRREQQKKAMTRNRELNGEHSPVTRLRQRAKNSNYNGENPHYYEGMSPFSAGSAGSGIEMQPLTLQQLSQQQRTPVPVPGLNIDVNYNKNSHLTQSQQQTTTPSPSIRSNYPLAGNHPQAIGGIGGGSSAAGSVVSTPKNNSNRRNDNSGGTQQTLHALMSNSFISSPSASNKANGMGSKHQQQQLQQQYDGQKQQQQQQQQQFQPQQEQPFTHVRNPTHRPFNMSSHNPIGGKSPIPAYNLPHNQQQQQQQQQQQRNQPSHFNNSNAPSTNTTTTNNNKQNNEGELNYYAMFQQHPLSTEFSNQQHELNVRASFGRSSANSNLSPGGTMKTIHEAPALVRNDENIKTNSGDNQSSQTQPSLMNMNSVNNKPSQQTQPSQPSHTTQSQPKNRTSNNQEQKSTTKGPHAEGHRDSLPF